MSPTAIPASAKLTSVPNDAEPVCTKLPAAMPPNLSAFDAVPWNLWSVLVTPPLAFSVFLSVKPFLTLSKPGIALFASPVSIVKSVELII